jgi:hypothetical protein
MAGGNGLRIRILGTLDAWDGDAEVELGGRRQRGVLAVLLLARGEIVPAERIADCLWGDDLPANAGGAVQSYVSHLRRRLQPDGAPRARGSVIVSAGSGYALRPVMPGVPEPIAGRMTLSVRFLWTGRPEDGERWFSRMRSSRPRCSTASACTPTRRSTSCTPTRSTPCPHPSTRRCSPRSIRQPRTCCSSTPGRTPGRRRCWSSCGSSAAPTRSRATTPSAFAHRSAAYSLLAIGIAGMPGVQEDADRLVGALRPWDTGRVWPNFAPPHDAASARRAYDPATLARPTEVSQRYDPHGVLQAGAYTRA